MKANLLITIVVILASLATLNAQNVYIPDPYFKSALVGNAAINTNADTEIQVSEAASYSSNLDVSELGISYLEGIQAFTALVELDCSANQLISLDVTSNAALTELWCVANQLTSLDVSSNTALTVLNCGYNELTSLDVSANTALVELYCRENQLTSLDVSANTALTSLGCSVNPLTSLDVSFNTALTELTCGASQLTSLDVSANTALTFLVCYTNQLTSLNIQNGNNVNITNFIAFGNPGLNCVQVDDIVFMNTNHPSAIDASASYSTACIPDNISYALITDINAYPNPTTGLFHLSDFRNVILMDITGKVILEKQHVNVLDISGEPSGMYSLLLRDSNGEFIQRMKVIKE